MVKKTVPEKLESVDMRGNLVKNGVFRQLKGWNQIHKTNSSDEFSIEWSRNHCILERSKSGSEYGKLGLSQNIDVNVSRYKALLVSFDVWVDFHTLPDPGNWARTHGGLGEMPLMISIKYQDVNDHLQAWSCGFITRTEKFRNAGENRNITIVPERRWHHFLLDLMDDSLRLDSSGKTLPRPKKVLQVNIHGKGWDFRSAMANLKLSSKAARPRKEPRHPPKQQKSSSLTPPHPAHGAQSDRQQVVTPPPTRSNSLSMKKGTRSRRTTTQENQPVRKQGKSQKDKQVRGKKPGNSQTPAKDKKQGRPTGKERSIEKEKVGPSTTRKRSPPKKTRTSKGSPSATPHPPPEVIRDEAILSDLQSEPTVPLPKSFKYDRVYVDASNVAHGADLKKPTVNNILLVAEKLRSIGFTKVIIIADASLRHKIDDKKRYEELLTQGFISQAPAKTEADEFLIGFAKQKIGYIVTNDRLEKWMQKDPWVKDNLYDIHIQFMIQEDMVLFVGFPT